MRIRTRLGILVATGTVLAACGGSDEPDRAPRGGSGATTPPETRSATTQPPTGCAAQGRAVAVDPASTAATRRAIDAAALRAKRSGHRFEQRLELRSPGLRATARVEGRRLPDGSSTAALTWTSAARFVLPDLRARIVDDRLYLLRDDRPAWSLAGSASGIALDVGRELLDHSFLLDPVSARASAPHASLDLVAPAPRLRAYATTERRGPVTDLLAGTRRLTITAHATGRRLTGDDFTLVTRVPASLDLPGPRAGSLLTVVARSHYCPLRPVDRRPISAPSVTG